MPLKSPEPFANAIEENPRGAAFRQLHVADADFGRLGGATGAAKRFRQELMAETDAQERHAAAFDRLADQGFLRAEPRVDVLFPGIHHTAHDPERVEFVDRRRIVPFLKLDSAPLVPVLFQKGAKDTGMFHALMLQHQYSHRVPSLWAYHSAPAEFWSSRKTITYHPPNRLACRVTCITSCATWRLKWRSCIISPNAMAFGSMSGRARGRA